MELVLGFMIAALIAMTGVGAGTVTAPLLILFLHVPVPAAIGTALAYSAAVKLVVVPVQIWRRQVVWRTLGVMLLTGVPGVVLGALFFHQVARRPGNTLWLYLALGSMIALSSAWHIYRHFRPAAERAESFAPAVAGGGHAARGRGGGLFVLGRGRAGNAGAARLLQA